MESTNGWTTASFKLFFSHSSTKKQLVTEIKNELFLKYGAYSFVAHEDITPAKEWLKEIQNALTSCNVLVAFLCKKFKTSDYCDQEVGYALNRNILIIPVSLELNPYGFIAPFQRCTAFQKSPQEIAFEIWQLILNDHRTKELGMLTQNRKLNQDEETALHLVDLFLNSHNQLSALQLFNQLNLLCSIPQQYVRKVSLKWMKNESIVKGVGQEKILNFIKQFSK